MGLAAAGLLAFMFLIAACGRASQASAAERAGRPIKVATTIYPIEYFTGRIGGDRVEVVNLIPPGIEAHDFEPKVSDLLKIARSDLLIYNGAGFEPWIGRALDALGGDAPAATESIKLLQGSLIAAGGNGGSGGKSIDPHIWLSPVSAAVQVEAITRSISELDPASAGVYEANRDRLVMELESLDSAYRQALSSCGHDTFVTSHSAYGYVAAEYGLRQVGVAGLSPDAEPRPATLARIAGEMEKLGLSHVMVEPVVNSRIADALARETGATVLPLHPLETLTVEEKRSGSDYFSIMESNLESLVTALDCNN